MPSYEVLNARVKQKINTEAQWIAEETAFGVIFEGEQAFVYNDAGDPVNFKIGDGTKMFSELPYFIAYYSGVTAQKILSYITPASNITIGSTFKNLSLIQDIILINNSGAPIDLKIGTSDGGNEIAEIIVPTGPVTIGLKAQFTDVETVYLTGLAGLDFSLFVLWFQLDEAPAIPPTTPSGTFKLPKGFRGMFEVLPGVDVNSIWDFASGLGKAGTGFDNCALAGTQGTQSLDGKYVVGFKTGDTIGGHAGNAANAVLIARVNLPDVKLGMFTVGVNPNPGDTPGVGDNVSRARSHSTDPLNYEIVKSVGGSFVGLTDSLNSATAVKLNIQPDSIISLFYTAIS